MRAGLFILIPFLAYSFDLSTTCPTYSKFYDTSLMACSACGSNKVASSDYSECICSLGLVKSVETRDLTLFECTSCTSGVPSSDQYECQLCPSSILNAECVCSTSEIIDEFSDDTNYLATKVCVACTSATYPGPGNYECEKCPDPNMTRNPSTYECECDAKTYYVSQDSCVSQTAAGDIIKAYPIDQSVVVTYTDLQTASGVVSKDVSSDTFLYYYLKAAYNCDVVLDVNSCQTLANLCVLQLYNVNTEVCQLYKSITASRSNITNAVDPGQKEGMAWIYYERNAKTVLDEQRVSMEVTFDSSDSSKINSLEFMLAEFYLNGTFIAYENLTDQLVLCPHSYTTGDAYRKFGTNVQVTCSFDLSVFIDYSETVFYELYLIDSDGSLIDIPILIENFVDSDGSEPNMSSDKSNWKLFRRFFIYDNVSGKEGTGSYTAGTQTNYLQYMREATLQVTLINDQDQMIYAPLLILRYRARMTTYLNTETSTDTISFNSEYTMNTARFWYIAEGVFIGLNIIILIISLLRGYIWSKNNPSAHVRDTYTNKLILQVIWYLSGTWGFIMFWYLIGVTAYWFIFYKMQYHVYALVPPLSTYSTNYLPFAVVFGIVLATQLLWVIYLIISQTNTDIILIDREQPQDAFRPGVDRITAAIYRDNSDYRKYVSAWRTLMVTNEFAELQSSRYISIELTLFFLLFFLKGLSWEDLARAKPQMTVADTGISMIPFNPVLRFFLTSFLFLIIAYVQLILRKVMSTWFPTSLQNFVDLCVVSNISLLILDDSLHGYYIHGITPLVKADMALEELHEGLSDDKMKANRKRSLLDPTEDELFTFEVYLPFAMRVKYDSIVQQAFASEKENQKTMDYMNFQKTRMKLNESFKAFFDPEINNLRNFVFEKSSLQRVLSMPPTEMGAFDGSVFFYKDPAMGFENVLFMGKEFSLLLLDILVFALMDLTVGNSLVSALTTYLFNKAISYVRYSLGESNIAKKTMVDKRFII